MAPTIFRAHGFRFFFFSREEPRLHVHVNHAEGGSEILAGTKDCACAEHRPERKSIEASAGAY
jgi:hypothetical protein